MISPKPLSYDAFPESTEGASGMEVLTVEDPDFVCNTHLNVQYAMKDDRPLHLHIVEPRAHRQKEGRSFPLIVYVQGSAWLRQNIGLELAQLAQVARRGFVVAIVEYRPSTTAPFPAQIQDANTALQFMLNHAADYSVDPDNVILWGDSSGAHTAVMMGITQELPQFHDGIAECNPARIRAIVDYYGPTDIRVMNEEPSTMDHLGADSPEGLLIGGVPVLEYPELASATVPMNYLDRDRWIPPILILHGSRDRLVPFGQSVRLFDALRQFGKQARFFKVAAADHGGPEFWTPETLDVVEGYVRQFLAGH